MRAPEEGGIYVMGQAKTPEGNWRPVLENCKMPIYLVSGHGAQSSVQKVRVDFSTRQSVFRMVACRNVRFCLLVASGLYMELACLSAGRRAIYPRTCTRHRKLWSTSQESHIRTEIAE